MLLLIDVVLVTELVTLCVQLMSCCQPSWPLKVLWSGPVVTHATNKPRNGQVLDKTLAMLDTSAFAVVLSGLAAPHSEQGLCSQPRSHFKSL